jgi:hypothetical protein
MAVEASRLARETPHSDAVWQQRTAGMTIAPVHTHRNRNSVGWRKLENTEPARCAGTQRIRCTMRMAAIIRSTPFPLCEGRRLGVDRRTTALHRNAAGVTCCSCSVGRYTCTRSGDFDAIADAGQHRSTARHPDAPEMREGGQKAQLRSWRRISRSARAASFRDDLRLVHHDEAITNAPPHPCSVVNSSVAPRRLS